MKLRDRMGHAANVVKWKADQQRRILAKQGEIRDVESQIRNLKSSLSLAALELHDAGKLKEESLVEICDQIADSRTSISSKEKELEVIRNEEPPEEPESPAVPADVETSGLICPECGRALVGKFCPEHGVEGMEPESKVDADEAADATADASEETES